MSCRFLMFLFTLCLALTWPGVLFARLDPDSVIVALNRQIRLAGTDSLRIEKLNDLAFFYQDHLDDKRKADQLSDSAILIARMSFRNDLLILAYNRYLEVNDLRENQEKPLDYAYKALVINAISPDTKQEWRIFRNFAEVYLQAFKYDRASRYANLAVKRAETLKNDTLRAECLVLVARSLDGKNQRMDAFSYFLDALDLAEKLNDNRLLTLCYSSLSRFYKNIKLYENAIKYKNLEGLAILHNYSINHTALMFLQYDLLVIDMEMHQNRLDDKTVDMVLDYAVRNGNERLKNFMLALYRKHLIDENNIGELYTLYHTRFPQELEKMRTMDPAMYARLQAYFNEGLNHPDSAELYFQKAAKLMEGSFHTVMKSNLYNRWGQFCLRQGKSKEAIAKFKKAYELASSSNYFNYMLSASKQIESVYRGMGYYKDAYEYSSLNRALTDSISNAARKEEVILLEVVRKENSMREETRLEKEATDRKMRQRQLERNMMASGIGFMLILSLVVFRGYRVQKKYNRRLDEAKKRSDDLLLNILPFETAEELKLKGSAEAKRFDQVTVMFTDFKNFTLASEKMSAEELVREIHSYFSEFDRIIVKYNLEKIKIIGDSYMCVGGLPVENSTHAFDAVSAALELQEYIASQKRIRLSDNRHFFELRIGIHTGPVVAGIVGIKKFAYDIWGDTVNTASRMENCGEVNRVNISGSTYSLIKDRYRCTYRGKIKAKHKGEIDMYFVEPY